MVGRVTQKACASNSMHPLRTPKRELSKRSDLVLVLKFLLQVPERTRVTAHYEGRHVRANVSIESDDVLIDLRMFGEPIHT